MKVVDDDTFIMVKPRSRGMPSDDDEVDEAEVRNDHIFIFIKL